jgi:hypothetical protein
MRQIGTALNHASRPRGGKERQRVRRESHRRGRCEATFWRRTSRQEVQRVVLGAKRFETEGLRQPGCPSGPLGHVALGVLELMANLVDFRTGRLEPTYAYLMDKLGRSKDAISRALTALQEHGFLEKLRRYEGTGLEGQRGPQVRQTANAYRLTLPERARRLLGRIMQSIPLPDDVVQVQEERTAEREAYKAALPLDELARFETNDDALGRLLAIMARNVQERESARQGETGTNDY